MVCRFLAANPRVPPSVEAQKLVNFVDDFQWHSTHDILLAKTHDELTVWCAPSSAFFTAELMPMLESALRLLFDAADINAFVTARDGALCGVPVSRFLIVLHEVIEIHRNWKMVLQICRAANEQSQWAVCATSAVQGGELDSAQEDYAALSLIDHVMFLGRVKKMKSPTARHAMAAVLQGRVGDAEEILIQGGASFARGKMNISMGRWDRAPAIAKRTNKYLEVVAAH
jgi:hypothetical protein